jgi:predicted PurR-regulated permease PerM
MPALSPNRFPPVSKPVPEASITTIVVGVVVVAALYLGREVLVPIALAVLLSFILSPCVRVLQRVYFPRVVAVIAVGLVAFSAIFALGTLMVSQVNGLASDLPRYQTTLGAKIDSLRGAVAGTSTLERASEVLHDLSQQLRLPHSRGRDSEQANSCRSQTTRPRRAADPVEADRAVNSTSYDNRHSHYFCNLHFASASGSEE